MAILAHTLRKTVEEYYGRCINSPGAGMTPRVQQLDFASDIAEMIAGNYVSILESKTGTGKTLTYLLAAAVTAQGDSTRTVTIATPQKHLQQEIIETFERHVKPLFPKISIALLKGRVNYVSLGALEVERMHIERNEELADEARAGMLVRLEDFREYVDEMKGDIDLIETTDPARIPEFVDLSRLVISAGSADDDDYYTSAKEAARDARIIVTNHTMLLMSAMMASGKRRGFLPLENLIIDEGHSFINAAYNALHYSVAIRTVEDTIYRIRDLVEFMDVSPLKFKGTKTLLENLGKAARKTREIRDSIMDKTNQITGPGNGSGKKNRVIHMRQYQSSPAVNARVKEINGFVSTLSDVLSETHKTLVRHHKPLARMKGMENFLGRFSDIVSSVKRFVAGNAGPATRQAGGGSYYYVSLSRDRGYPSIGAAKYDIGGWLANILWSKVNSVVLTSGTVADPNSLYAPLSPIPGETRLSISCNHMLNELGIKIKLPGSRLGLMCAYTPHFEWKDVMVHLYSKAPVFQVDKDGDARDAKSDIAVYALPLIIKALRKTTGGGLALMPAYEDAAMLVEYMEVLKKAGRNGGTDRRLIAQQPFVSIRSCVEEHRKDPGKSLLALVGGWEGLDLPGEQLTALFILRIPHGSPDDPVYVARKAARARSRSSYIGFRTEEFWRFRQGLGRLLRREGDHGEIHIFDSRIVNDPGHVSYMKFVEREFAAPAGGKKKIVIH